MEIYDSHYLAVYRSALRILGSEVDAEEVAHDALLRYFSLLPTARSTINEIRGWLCRIAINRAIDILRSKKVQLVDFSTIDYKVACDEEQEQEGDYTIEMVREAIEGLADKYRVVINLRLFEGYDYSEIGDILDIEESSVRSIFHRAKSKLLERLKR